ncbi:MAG TPA: ATP-dependent DNA helicase RecQ [Candidatus Limnocylindria bacterium]|nr:ATP-dependent DNA helicase RecQ [Candidatus Limnocylindria bacterium]
MPQPVVPHTGLVTPADVLRDVFKLESFRPGQAEVVDAQMQGRDVLAVAPTGSGKSLSYWVPAILGDGLTVVVSPLIALMKDQVDRLVAHGVRAAFINSTLNSTEQRERLERASRGEYQLVYVAPERFSRPGFTSRLATLGVRRFIVDEAHCISTWGHDFRPDYRLIGGALEACGHPPIGAFTATATPDVRRDIAANLGLRDPLVMVTGFNRPNLRLESVQARGARERLEKLHRRLDPGDGRALVYVGTVKGAESTAAAISRWGFPAAPYHGRLPDASRRRIQDGFAARDLRVVVATSAFGMGVDFPDIRQVIHVGYPGSVEAYYQEAGRAGRDGKPALCLLIRSGKDRDLQVYFIETAFPDLREVLSAHTAYSRLGVWNSDPEELRPLMPEAAWRSLDASKRLLLKAGALHSDGSVGRFDPSALDFKQLAAHKQQAYTKLGQMIQYAELRSCRHAFITDYFGETTSERSCRSCDNCEHGPLDEAPGAPVDPSVIRTALAGAARFAGRIGIVNLAAILAGKENRFSRDQPWVLQVPVYGSLAGLGPTRVRRLLEELVTQGCLSQSQGQYPMVELADRGRAVLGGTESVELSIAPEPAPAAGLPADPALFQRLREWRSEVARRQGVPAYVVFHDRTLTELAARRPADLIELEALPGIGRSKLDRYGKALLEILGAPIH